LDHEKMTDIICRILKRLDKLKLKATKEFEEQKKQLHQYFSTGNVSQIKIIQDKIDDSCEVIKIKLYQIKARYSLEFSIYQNMEKVINSSQKTDGKRDQI